MIILIIVLHVIVCLFLIAVILLQAGRGQGLSWGVFGGTPQSILGTKTASFLSRVTTICAILFMLTCISLNIIETRKSRSLVLSGRPTSQIDFAKIKKALEEAEKTQVVKTAQAPEAAQTATEKTTEKKVSSPEEKSTLPVSAVPAPPEKK